MELTPSPSAWSIAVTAGVLALAAHAHGHPAENSSEKLAKTLRRQLMKDNYDYMSTESDEPLAPPGHIGDRKPQSNEETGSDDKRGDTDNRNGKVKRNDDVDQIYDESRARDVASGEAIERLVRARVEQKLARRVKARGYLEEFEEDIARRHLQPLQGRGAGARGGDSSQAATERAADHTTTVTYKILKLGSPSRRSGDATLIQEEAADHVALVSLGGPVPPLRLQHVRGDLPPPPAGGSDEAGDEERTRKPSRKKLETDAGAGDALRMTITPDGIFVL